MTETTDVPEETPIQRALRLKQAAMEARARQSRGGQFPPNHTRSEKAGKSKPWMSR
ncbi:MAG: hypothetical protein ACK41P_00655 [Asticcacaulis sp.]